MKQSVPSRGYGPDQEMIAPPGLAVTLDLGRWTLDSPGGWVNYFVGHLPIETKCPDPPTHRTYLNRLRLALFAHSRYFRQPSPGERAPLAWPRQPPIRGATDPDRPLRPAYRQTRPPGIPSFHARRNNLESFPLEAWANGDRPFLVCLPHYGPDSGKHPSQLRVLHDPLGRARMWLPNRRIDASLTGPARNGFPSRSHFERASWDEVPTAGIDETVDRPEHHDSSPERWRSPRYLRRSPFPTGLGVTELSESLAAVVLPRCTWAMTKT